MTFVLTNIILGFFPTIALAWSMASDDRKVESERVVVSADDRRQQRTIFLLVSGLWFLTLAMWNWMRSEPVSWIAAWLVFGVGSLILCRVFAIVRSRRRT